jgi:phosphatidylglycerophosphate synthase
MLDRVTLKWVRPPLIKMAQFALRFGVKADQVTLFGFAIGMLALPALATGHFGMALLFICLNRILDGLDGAVARLTEATEQGAYLDIVLDFIFYSAVIFGFALADPARNALPAAALIFSFVGTGSSFLAFAVFAERLQLQSMRYPNKGFYYLTGIAEGTETIGFFVLMCLFPSAFPILAGVFFGLCVLTTLSRVIGGAHTLKARAKPPQ